MSRAAALRDRALVPVDAAPFVLFRAVFGAALVVVVLRYFIHGWIPQQFHAPGFFFSWSGFEAVRPWPSPWMHVHFAVLGGLALAVAFGFHTRPAAGLFCAGFTYVHLIDKTNYLNHYYLISLLTGLTAVLPLHRRSIPAFALWTLRFQVGAVYFFAGLAKVQGDWLFRAQPLRLWLAHAAGTPLIGPALAWPPTAFVFSGVSMVFDLLLPFLILSRPLRPWVLATAVVFHVLTAVLFPIGMFPWIMLVCLLLFLSPEEARRLLPRLPPAIPSAPEPLRPWRLAPVLMYAAVQIVLPLRHWAVPGDDLWTEACFRFSWKVMLIDKTSEARFVAEDPRTGERWEVDPATVLTPVQQRAMSTQPDMILAFAREIGRRASAERGHPVAVRARVRTSLNGLPSGELIDPTVDLSVESRRPGHGRWILPRP